MIPVRFTLEIKTRNPLNGQGFGSRFAGQGAAKKQRKLAYETTLSTLKAARLPTRQKLVKARVVKGVEKRPAFLREVVDLPQAKWVTELVRLSRGQLDSHDALGPALKSIVDGIADALDVNDGDRSRFAQPEYSQRKAKGFAVEVTIGIAAAPRARPSCQADTKKPVSQFDLFAEGK